MPTENTEGQKVTTTVVETKPAPPPAPKGSMETTVTITQTDTPLKQAGRWALALWAGFVKGGSHAVVGGTIVIGYETFKGHPFTSLKEVLAMYCALFLVNGVLSAFFYLESHPIPKEWNPETSPERRKDSDK